MSQILSRETLRKLQLCELLCLDEVKRICEENNIPYFLIGGTLIGAVRGKGFIPWDDDIDIGMLRSDYERFCSIAPEKINKEKFFFQIPQTESGCADFAIARIRLNNTHIVLEHRKNLKLHDGFFVEVFPYDSLPPTAFKATVYHEKFLMYKKIAGNRLGYNYTYNKFYKRFIFTVVKTFSYITPIKKLCKRMNNYYKKYDDATSSKVFLLSGAYDWKKESHLRTTVQEYTELEFEGKMYPVPKNYDLFLREQYGDYMTPPDEADCFGKLAVEAIDFGPYGSEE